MTDPASGTPGDDYPWVARWFGIGAGGDAAAVRTWQASKFNLQSQAQFIQVSQSDATKDLTATIVS